MERIGTMNSSWNLRAVLSLFLIVGWIYIAWGQLPTAEPTVTAPAEARSPEIPAAYASPQATLATFLSAMSHLEDDRDDSDQWERALGALDAPRSDGEARKEIAWQLRGIFNGLEIVDPEADPKVLFLEIDEIHKEGLTRVRLFPDNPAPDAEFVFRAALDELGTPPGRIELALAKNGRWLFSARTLGDVGTLFAWIGDRDVRTGATDVSDFSSAAAMRDLVPDALEGHTILALEIWQWIGLLILGCISVTGDFLARAALRPILRRIVTKSLGEPDASAVRAAARPIGIAAGAYIFRSRLGWLGISGHPLTALMVATHCVIALGLSWAAWSVVELIADAWTRRASRTTTTFDDMIIPLATKSAKFFVVTTGLVYVADRLDILGLLAPLIAGFGVVGLAVSFAAQDMVKNLFGGMTIFLDQPFHIGDRINFQGFDGTIEKIGFRTTRLRTLQGHQVTIPNGAITNEPVENVGRRPAIRRILNVTITYDTPLDKIQQAVHIIRDILEEDGIREPIHPFINGVRNDPRVYFNELNAESLNIFVLYWYAPPEYWDYMEHAERFHLRIFEEFEKAGIEFAFPTQTLHLAGDAKRELAVRMLSRET